jgi:hypothetical protein
LPSPEQASHASRPISAIRRETFTAGFRLTP